MTFSIIPLARETGNASVEPRTARAASSSEVAAATCASRSAGDKLRMFSIRDVAVFFVMALSQTNECLLAVAANCPKMTVRFKGQLSEIFEALSQTKSGTIDARR
jgi:hypothetical protein